MTRNRVPYFFFYVIFIALQDKFTKQDFTENVILSSENFTWRGANAHCTMAGINRNGDVMEENLLFNVRNISTFSEAWLGAFVLTTEWIGHFGCKFGQIKSDGYVTKPPTDPLYDCYKTCPKGFVLTVDKCFCKQEVEIQQSGCLAESCFGKSDSLCGENTTLQASDQELVCMCEYRTVDIPDFDETRGNCMTLQPKGIIPMLQNADCTEELPSICRSNQPVLESSYMNWSTAALKCYQNNNQFYHEFTSLFDVQAWVAIFRKSRSIWGNPYSERRKRQPRCLAAISNKQGKVIGTRAHNCFSTLPALCQIADDRHNTEPSSNAIAIGNNMTLNWVIMSVSFTVITFTKITFSENITIY